jgi:hypothetical protein
MADKTSGLNDDRVAVDHELSASGAEASMQAPGHDGIVSDAETDPDRRDLRSEIGKHVSLASFPATADDLVRVAIANGAPEEVLQPLRGLESMTTFENTQDLWRALGLETKERF